MCQKCYDLPRLQEGILKSESVLGEIEKKIIELAHIIRDSEQESKTCMLGPRTRDQYLGALAIMIQARQHMKIMREEGFNWDMSQFRANVEIGANSVAEAFGWDEEYMATMVPDEEDPAHVGGEAMIDVLKQIFGPDATIIPFTAPDDENDT